MKGIGRWLVSANILLSALFFALVPPLRAPGASQTTGLQLYGTVDVHHLPLSGNFKGKLKHHLFYVADPDTYSHKKADADSGLSTSSRASTGSTKSPSISVGPGAGFVGMSLADSSLGAVPPDTQVAAGAGFVVEVVNINIRVWNTNVSPATVTDFDLIDFFGVYYSDVVSDPRIRFDSVQQRWYLSCVSIEQTFANPPQGDFRLAVSTSSDPTQAFNLYAATTTGAFPDFPHLGFNEDKLVLTGNSYSLPIESAQFLGTEFLVANLSDLLNSSITSPHTQFFGAPQGLDSISPADSLSSSCSGGVCRLFMAAVPDASLPPPANILRIWSLQGVPGVGGGVTFTTTDLNIALLSIPPGAVQEGSANLIDTNDARLLDAIYRNGSLWISSNTGCTPSGDTTTRACLHFSQVNTATLSLSQDFVFGEPGVYYYYPAIQTDSSNNLVAVFNQSSNTEYPSIYVSGQGAGAAPGTFGNPVVVLEGQFPLTPSSATFNRWGDYSGAGLDPSGATVWVAGEYVHSASNDDWGTFIAPVQFSSSSLTATTTTLMSSASPSTYGQMVTFTATVDPTGGTPTGTVTFKDSAATLGSGTLNTSGVATLSTSTLAAGPHSITAIYGGDSNFAGSTSTVLAQMVNTASTTTAVSSSGNPSTYGSPVTFTGTVTSTAGTPTAGTVAFMDGTTTLGTGNVNASGVATFNASSLTAGAHSITAVYGGGGNFAGSTSSVLTQTVNQATTATMLVSNANPSMSGQLVTLTATVTSGAGTPTGTVTFKDGSTTLGAGTLGSTSQATFATSTLSVGSHSITAVYGGDNNFAGGISPALAQAVQATTTTALSSSVNPSTFGQPVTFTATVTSSSGTPSGTVTFKDGSTALGAGTLNSSGQATFTTSALSVGPHSIAAAYSGGGNFAGSTSPVLTQNVNQGAATTTTLSSSSNPSVSGKSVVFTATVVSSAGTPSGSVTFKDGSTTLGTGALNASAQATFTTSGLSVGTHSITAVYAGNGNFVGSTSAALKQVVKKH
jgi:hypothetical protein